LLVASIASISFAGAVSAQDAPYPNRPITLVVPTAPGGTTDISARMLAEPLGKALGQSIVVDNKGGGNGVIAAMAVKRAEPNGYTLLMQYSGYHVITPHVSQQKPQWSAEDFRPVANVVSAPQLVVVREGIPVKTLAELIAYAKANPGKLTYASPGHGTSPNIGMELMAAASGVKFSEVPFKSTSEVNIAVAGNHAMCGATGLDAKPLADAGKLKFVNVWTATPNPKLPGVPTLKELGYPYVFDSPWGVAGPKGMDPKVVAKLQDAFKKALDDKLVREALDKYDMIPNYMDAATYTKFVADYMVSERAALTKLGLAKN
jgi:tripartite-type tricarboxylate transporter receptor subunit TctC